MRVVDVFLGASVVLALAGLTVRTTRRPGAEGAATPAGVAVTHELAPRWVDVAPEAAAGGGGCVRFDVEGGADVVGIANAKLYPLEGERVRVESWDDVTTAQRDGVLDLRTWLERRNPSGTQALLVAVALRSAGTQEYRVGWARFEASDLSIGDVRVSLPSARSCDVVAATDGGQHVPGALVALAPAAHTSGVATLLLHTGHDGALRVSGLDAAAWSVALPEGLGPDPSPVTVDLRAGMERVVLTSPLRGTWTFLRAGVRVPLDGAALRLTQLRPAGGGRLAAWPVSAHVPTGSEAERPFWWMRIGEGDSRPLPVELTFDGFEPAQVADAGSAFVLRVPTPSRPDAPATEQR